MLPLRKDSYLGWHGKGALGSSPLWIHPSWSGLVWKFRGEIPKSRCLSSSSNFHGPFWVLSPILRHFQLPLQYHLAKSPCLLAKHEPFVAHVLMVRPGSWNRAQECITQYLQPELRRVVFKNIHDFPSKFYLYVSLAAQKYLEPWRGDEATIEMWRTIWVQPLHHGNAWWLAAIPKYWMWKYHLWLVVWNIFYFSIYWE